MTISKIDNRLLWKCIFGTFKKSLVVSLILFLSFFLPISFSLIFSVTLAFAYVQFAVSSLALVHGCFQRIQRVFSVRCLSFTYTFLSLSLVFSISTSFSLCLFLTLSVSFYTPLNTYALFLSSLQSRNTDLLTNIHCTKLSAHSLRHCLLSHTIISDSFFPILYRATIHR